MDNGWTWTSTDGNETYEMNENDVTRLLGGIDIAHPLGCVDIKEAIYQTTLETIRNMRWLFPTKAFLD